MVARRPVKAKVVGSNPTRGVGRPNLQLSDLLQIKVE